MAWSFLAAFFLESMRTRFRGHHPDDFIRHPDRGISPDDIGDGAVSAEQHRMIDSHKPEAHLLQGDEGPINDHGLPLGGKER